VPLTKTEGLLLSNDDLVEGLMQNSNVATGLMSNLPIYKVEGDSVRVERVNALGIGVDPTFMQGQNPEPVGSTDAVPDVALEGRYEVKGLVQDVQFNEFSIFNQSSVNFLPDTELTAAKLRLLYKLEDAAINGNQLVNPAEFDGLSTLTSPSQTIQTNDTVNNTLDILDLVRLIAKVRQDGGNMMMVTSRRGFLEIARTLFAHGISFGPMLEEPFEGNFLTRPGFDTPSLSDAILGALEGPAGSWLTLQTALSFLAPGFAAPIIGKRGLAVRKNRPIDPPTETPDGSSPSKPDAPPGIYDPMKPRWDPPPPWEDKKPVLNVPWNNSGGPPPSPPPPPPPPPPPKKPEKPGVPSVDRFIPADKPPEAPKDEGSTSEGDYNDAGPTFGGAFVAISDKVPTNEVIGSFNDGTSIFFMNTGPTGVFGATTMDPEMQCRRVLTPATSQEAYRMYTNFTLVVAREDALARLQIRPTSASQIS
jgi:hypothetical protein